jgi:hypothetical protein
MEAELASEAFCCIKELESGQSPKQDYVFECLRFFFVEDYWCVCA